MTKSVAKEAEQQLNVLMEHEELLAELYKVYGEKFGENLNFWMELSEEETCHSSWLNDLQNEIGDCPDAMIVDRFPILAIESSIEYVKRQIEKAGNSELKHVNALLIARDLEAGLIENKYFEVLEGDHPRVKQVLQLLSQSTREHLEMIRDAVKAEEDTM
jgi:hypothetical protein